MTLFQWKIGWYVELRQRITLIYTVKQYMYQVAFESRRLHYFLTALVYSPRAGGIQPPRGQILMSTETSCHFGHLLLGSNLRRQ